MRYLQIAMVFCFLTLFSCKRDKNMKNTIQQESIKPKTSNNIEADTLALNNKDSIKTIQQEFIKPETSNNIEADTLALNNEDSIKIEYKINDLPISLYYENELSQIALPVNWVTIKIDSAYDDAFLAFLPKKDKYQPVIYSGCYEFGNCDKFLIILDDNYKEISRIKLYYNDAPDGNVENYTYSTYLINKNYDIKITTYKVIERSNKIIKKDSSDKYYLLNNRGIIEQK